MMRVEILNLGRSRILTDRENVLFSAANHPLPYRSGINRSPLLGSGMQLPRSGTASWEAGTASPRSGLAVAL